MNKKQQIKKNIENVELQIKRLYAQTPTNEICENLLNSLIVRKAILNKQLKDLDSNNLVSKFKKLLPKKEKLICDYFN